MKIAGTAPLIALAALACQQDQGREGPTGLTSLVRDSAGIQIVENPAPLAGSLAGDAPELGHVPHGRGNPGRGDVLGDHLRSS